MVDLTPRAGDHEQLRAVGRPGHLPDVAEPGPHQLPSIAGVEVDDVDGRQQVRADLLVRGVGDPGAVGGPCGDRHHARVEVSHRRIEFDDARRVDPLEVVEAEPVAPDDLDRGGAVGGEPGIGHEPAAAPGPRDPRELTVGIHHIARRRYVRWSGPAWFRRRTSPPASGTRLDPQSIGRPGRWRSAPGDPGFGQRTGRLGRWRSARDHPSTRSDHVPARRPRRTSARLGSRPQLPGSAAGPRREKPSRRSQQRRPPRQRRRR